MALFVHDGKAIPDAPQYKDPDSTVDYSVDWASWLGADTISASTWLINDTLSASVDGITITATSNTTTTATAWMSGGTELTTYTFTNRITTSGGRVEDRSFTIEVRRK